MVHTSLQMYTQSSEFSQDREWRDKDVQLLYNTVFLVYLTATFRLHSLCSLNARRPHKSESEVGQPDLRPIFKPGTTQSWNVYSSTTFH